MKKESVNTVRTTKIREADILSAAIEYLEILFNQNKLRYLRVHPVRLVKKDGGFITVPVRRSQKGAPDVVVFFRKGYAAAFEFKRPGGKLTDEQLQWRLNLIDLGYECYVIESVDQFYVIVREHL